MSVAPNQPLASPTADTSRREVEFRQLFELPDDKLLDDYSCALQLKSLLLHGRLYISDKNVCFYANILGRKTTKVVPYSKILAVYKKSTAVVFSNALEIVSHKSKYFFTSFMFRDGAFKVITQAWADFIGDTTSKVVVKADGAEIFVRPNIAGDLPYASGDEDEPSSDEGKSADQNSPVSTKEESTRVSSPTTRFSQSMPTLPEMENIDHVSAKGKHSDQNGAASAPITPGENHKKRRKSVDTRKDVISSVSTQQKSSDTENGDPPSPGDAHARKKKRKGSTRKHKSASLDRGKKKSTSLHLQAAAGSNSCTTAPVTDGELEPVVGLKEIKESAAALKQKSPSSSPAPNKEPPAASEPSTSEETSPTIKPPINQEKCSHIDDDEKLTKLVEKEIPNFTVRQFWLLFYANTQFTEEFAKASHYEENWTITEWKLSEEKCCLNRTMNYKMPLHNTLGPKATRIDSDQRAKFKNKYHLIYESSNISKDVPFGDSFIVLDRWSVIQAGPNVKVTVYTAIKWKKSIWGLRNTIEKKAIEGSKESAELFFTMALPKIEQYNQERRLLLERQSQQAPSPLVAPEITDNLIIAQPASIAPQINGSVASMSSDEESDVEEEEDEEVIRSMQQRSSSEASQRRKTSAENGRVSASKAGDAKTAESTETGSVEPAKEPALPAPQEEVSRQVVNNQHVFVAIGQILATLPPNYKWLFGGLLFLGAAGFAFGLWSLIFLAFGPVFSASPAPISTQTPYWLHPDAIRSAPDYTLFLEHVVSLLIKNVSDPQNFVRTEHLFWKAWKQFETALRNHKEEIDAFYKSMTLLQVTKDDIDKVVDQHLKAAALSEWYSEMERQLSNSSKRIPPHSVLQPAG